MLQANELFDGTYRVIRQIGQGGTAAVYLAYHLRLQKYVVLKRIVLQTNSPQTLRQEADILKDLHHPCLPQVYDFIANGDEVYTVMDYVQGISLQEAARTMDLHDERLLLRWLRQLAEVLDYLHTHKPAVLHSDIKPDNILLTPDGQLCLIDFNISLDSAHPYKVRGYSPYFASPEQAAMAVALRQRQPCPYTLDARTDIYSLAATFYYLMTGVHPHAQRYSTPLREMPGLPYSPGLVAVIDKAMSWDREKRYASARQLLAALDALKKQDARYKRYLRLQAASWLAGSLLLALGVFCLVRGGQEQRLEAYRQDYGAFLDQVEQEQYPQALQHGLDLLNDARYRRILNGQPQDKALILHALGDASYESGDRESARRYYGDALSAAAPGDDQLDRYYLDYAITLIECSRPEQARQILAEAEAKGISAPACALIRAGLYSREGDAEHCEAEAEAVLAAETDPDLCARACLLAAQALQGGDPDRALTWLERARGCGGERPRVLRQLGAAYAEAAQRQFAAVEQQQLAQNALDCYQTLCARPYPLFEDRINCGIVLYMMGRHTDCIQQLSVCEQEQPDDHRVQTYLTFAYYELGDTANAAVHCSQALRCIAELPEDRQDTLDADAVQELTRLQRLMGI